MKTIIAFICLFAITANAQRINITIDRVTAQGVTNRIDFIELNAVRSGNLSDAVGNVPNFVRRSITTAIKDYKSAQVEATIEAEQAAAVERRRAALMAIDNEQE